MKNATEKLLQAQVNLVSTAQSIQKDFQNCAYYDDFFSQTENLIDSISAFCQVFENSYESIHKLGGGGIVGLCNLWATINTHDQ
jgi:hypothetical protein